MRDTFARMWPKILRGLRYAWDVLWRAIVKYTETDGEQRAASFAYYAFFALFPLLLLFVTIGTQVMGGHETDQEKAAQAIMDLVGKFIPVAEGQANWFVKMVEGILRSRNNANLVAITLLAWSAVRFFQALVHGVNKAWGTKEYSWWRLPIKNLFMAAILASALFLGVFAPPTIDLVEYYFALYLTGETAKYWSAPGPDFQALRTIFWYSKQIVPTVVLFYGFAMFYKFAPRRRTKFREVWVASVLVTFGLLALQAGFVVYATSITDFNRLYGTLASVVVLLMWIYLTGSAIIFGGCICAAQYEIGMHITDQSESSTAKP